MKFKPIESNAKNLLIILVVGPALGVANAFFEGEIHTWTDFPKALNHGAIMSVSMSFAWIAMKSPWAGTFKTLVGSFMSTNASGEMQESKVEASLPEGAGAATMTINPSTQEVTVKEQAATSPETK